MKLAITSDSQKSVLTLFDTDTEEVFRVESDERGYDYKSDNSRPPHRPYGITWSEDRIFIANRANLLIYDSDLKFVGCVEGVLDENTHQITYYENQIISTMTRKDCVKFINLEDYSSELFHVEKGWGSEFPSHEKYHINSVVVKDNLLYIMLHNCNIRFSQIVVLNLETRKIDSVIETKAKCAHGIYLTDNTIGTLNTSNQSLIVGSQEIRRSSFVNNFLRGLSGDKNKIVVGHFSLQKRHLRGFGEAYITVFENNNFPKEYCIEDIGAINDIRIIDGEDFCHHNKHAFPATLL